MGVTMSPTAISKVKGIMASQDPVPAALRLGVKGGGCSGFSYSMAFELEKGAMDKDKLDRLMESIKRLAERADASVLRHAIMGDAEVQECLNAAKDVATILYAQNLHKGCHRLT